MLSLTNEIKGINDHHRGTQGGGAGVQGVGAAVSHLQSSAEGNIHRARKVLERTGRCGRRAAGSRAKTFTGRTRFATRDFKNWKKSAGQHIGMDKNCVGNIGRMDELWRFPEVSEAEDLETCGTD